MPRRKLRKEISRSWSKGAGARVRLGSVTLEELAVLINGMTDWYQDLVEEDLEDRAEGIGPYNTRSIAVAYRLRQRLDGVYFRATEPQYFQDE
jgi:hypothetical protein